MSVKTQAVAGNTEEIVSTDVGVDSPVTEQAFWLVCALASGFVTISTQVAWTRILSMVIGSSTYAFSIVVALFLIGTCRGRVDYRAQESVS